MNHEVKPIKRTPQSNSFTNAEFLMVPIVRAYPYELQPKTIRSKLLTAKNENYKNIYLEKLKRVLNHVTTFKNTPQMFKKDIKDTSTTHIGSEYISKTPLKKDTIIVEPVSHHITYETTRKILGYQDLV